jgi:hypothetical protein
MNFSGISKAPLQEAPDAACAKIEEIMASVVATIFADAAIKAAENAAANKQRVASAAKNAPKDSTAKKTD